MRFAFPHSHAFPGGEVRIEDAEATEGKCVVEFGDGVAMLGDWHPDGDARRWRLVYDQQGRWRSKRCP
ncbi:hypothetical protein [Shinella sp.]|uniref:hypothetical protein n=1 Tax=unclassified Shinella TaxID=2643062 RepID=UPI0028AA6742|nr:hypothetical protein [Shinella sp.]